MLVSVNLVVALIRIQRSRMSTNVPVEWSN